MTQGHFGWAGLPWRPHHGDQGQGPVLRPLGRQQQHHHRGSAQEARDRSEHSVQQVGVQSSGWLRRFPVRQCRRVHLWLGDQQHGAAHRHVVGQGEPKRIEEGEEHDPEREAKGAEADQAPRPADTPGVAARGLEGTSAVAARDRGQPCRTGQRGGLGHWTRRRATSIMERLLR